MLPWMLLEWFYVSEANSAWGENVSTGFGSGEIYGDIQRTARLEGHDKAEIFTYRIAIDFHRKRKNFDQMCIQHQKLSDYMWVHELCFSMRLVGSELQKQPLGGSHLLPAVAMAFADAA